MPRNSDSFEHNPLKLNLPQADLKIRCDTNGNPEVYDILRRKYVTLEPEEYVRQNFIHYMINHLGYPVSHINNEVSLKLNDTSRRCDSLIFDHAGRPIMIVEYKAPFIIIDQDVFDQIVRYNMVLHARYLTVSNGLNHYCCIIDYEKGNYQFLPRVPAYDDIIKSELGKAPLN